METPSKQQIEEFAKLQWVRCLSCNKPITAKMQKDFDKLIAQKGTINDEMVKAYDTYYQQALNEGMEDKMATKYAEEKSKIYANVLFNKEVQDKVGIKRFCCFRTLQNPIILPMGSAVQLSSEVDIGERYSKGPRSGKTTNYVKAE